MAELLPSIITFVVSLFTYSLLRYTDQSSTKKVAKRLDIQKHEINPLLTWLAKKWGLDNAFRITFVIFALGVASTDVVINTPAIFGFPAVALFTGTLHALAATSNLELDYETKGLTPEQIEARTFRFAQQLSSLTPRARVFLLLEKYAFTFFVAVLSVIVFVFIRFGDSIAQLTNRPVLGAAMFNMALVILFSLLLFYPSLLMGILIWSRRLVDMFRKGQLQNPGPAANYIDMDVSVLKEALETAIANNAPTIRIQVDESF